MQNGQSVFLASLTSLALCFQPHSDLLFDCSGVLEYAKIQTVLQSKVYPKWHLLKILSSSQKGDPWYLYDKLHSEIVTLRGCYWYFEVSTVLTLQPES